MNGPLASWKKALIPMAVTSAMLMSGAVQAAPALEEPQQVTQPSGETFTATPRGDEWNNRMETPKGFTVGRGHDGVWRYVSGFDSDNAPVFTNTAANREAPPGLSKHLRSNASRPTGAPGLGTNSVSSSDSGPELATSQSNSPVLFILTEFNDRQGSTTEADWEGFVSNNVRDFFLQTSHGNAIVDPAIESSGTYNNGVINWVNVGYNHPNTVGSVTTTNRNLSRDAVLAADSSIDFSSYDSNSDGYISSTELSIVIVVAGYDTSYGGTGGALQPNVWGHKWSMPSGTIVDGVRLTTYAQFGELHATSLSNSHQATMGIMVHELGHLMFGLPDLYDTDNEPANQSNGIGPFGVMSGGSWGRSITNGDAYSGETPVNACAWSKYHMGWVDGFEGSGTESITDSGSGGVSNTVFRASSDINNEYFLVENRQPAGYDLGLEKNFGPDFVGGLALWHIDDSRTNNTDNNHRWVDIEEADGSTTANTLAALWTSSNGAFDDTGTPNSKLYDGSSSGVILSNISTSASTMTVDFGTPTPTIPDAPSNLSANATSPTGINLIWNDNSSNEDGFKVDRSLDGNIWSTINSAVAANSQSYNDSELDPSTTYYYRVRAFNAEGDSNNTGTASATTQQEPTPPAAPTGLNATAISTSVINLTWADNASDEDSYQLERSTDQSSWTTISLSANNTGYSDSGLDADTTYYYRVRAYKTNGGNSGYSNTANATTEQEAAIPVTPSGLAATDGTNGTAELTWSESDVANETGYEIQREKEHKKRVGVWNSTTLIGPIAAGNTSYTDNSGTGTFRYKIRAFNNSGTSDWSLWQPVTITESSGGGGGGGGPKPCRGKSCG